MGNKQCCGQTEKTTVNRGKIKRKKAGTPKNAPENLILNGLTEEDIMETRNTIEGTYSRTKSVQRTTIGNRFEADTYRDTHGVFNNSRTISDGQQGSNQGKDDSRFENSIGDDRKVSYANEEDIPQMNFDNNTTPKKGNEAAISFRQGS